MDDPLSYRRTFGITNDEFIRGDTMRALIFALAMLSLFLTACASSNDALSGAATFERIRQQTIAGAQSDFERSCYENNHVWMKMLPAKDGKPTSDKPCMGCMPDAKAHICDEAEYKEYLKQ